jgi:hypothetical protein
MGSAAWKVMGTGSAVAAAAVAERVLDVAWRAATGKEPPVDTEDPDTSWTEALAWAAVSGAVIGVARLVATRRAANYYRDSSGALPAALRRP